MKIKGIILTLEIDGVEHKLSLDDAERLYNELGRIVGPKTLINPRPFVDKIWGDQGPQITFCSSVGN